MANKPINYLKRYYSYCKKNKLDDSEGKSFNEFLDYEKYLKVDQEEIFSSIDNYIEIDDPNLELFATEITKKSDIVYFFLNSFFLICDDSLSIHERDEKTRKYFDGFVYLDSLHLIGKIESKMSFTLENIYFSFMIAQNYDYARKVAYFLFKKKTHMGILYDFLSDFISLMADYSYVIECDDIRNKYIDNEIFYTILRYVKYVNNEMFDEAREANGEIRKVSEHTADFLAYRLVYDTIFKGLRRENLTIEFARGLTKPGYETEPFGDVLALFVENFMSMFVYRHPQSEAFNQYCKPYFMNRFSDLTMVQVYFLVSLFDYLRFDAQLYAMRLVSVKEIEKYMNEKLKTDAKVLETDATMLQGENFINFLKDFEKEGFLSFVDGEFITVKNCALIYSNYFYQSLYMHENNLSSPFNDGDDSPSISG